MSVSFVCLFRGKSIQTARIVGTSTDRELVRTVAAEMLDVPERQSNDPALVALDDGYRAALKVIREEAAEDE